MNEALPSRRRGRILAESAAIIVSILLALAADAAWDRRSQRVGETIVLRDMEASLQGDTERIASVLDRLKQVEAAATALQSHLAARRPNEPRIDTLFGILVGTAGGAQPNRAVYEGLKARDLGLINDDRLRQAVVTLYDDHFYGLERVNTINGNVTAGRIHPYMVEHFKSIDIAVSATPLNYSVLMNDPVALNLVEFRLDVLRQTIIPRYELVLEAARDLRVALLDELASR